MAFSISLNRKWPCSKFCSSETHVPSIFYQHLSQPPALDYTDLLCRVGPYKLARILGLCLEHRSSVTGSPDSPMTPRQRAASYGFSPSADLSQETEQDVSRNVGQSNELREQSQLDVPTRSETMTRELSNTTTSPPTTPLLIKPRSIVLLVEDNSVNMKVCPHYGGSSI